MSDLFSSSSGNHQSLATLVSAKYALPTVAVAFLMSPIAIIQGIYAKYFGLSLTEIATVLLIARMFDAITDPVVGHLSDRFSARHGSRKAFILFGGLLFIISAYFLFVPSGSCIE